MTSDNKSYNNNNNGNNIYRALPGITLSALPANSFGLHKKIYEIAYIFYLHFIDEKLRHRKVKKLPMVIKPIIDGFDYT